VTICSPGTTAAQSPVCGAGKGTTTFYYEGLLGLGEATIGANSLEFTSVRATGHYTSVGPQSCFPTNNSDCKFTKGALYGTGPTGDCVAKGADCECAWTAQPMSQGSGSGGFTKNGNTLTWFGRSIPYCVTGTTVTMDLADVYKTEVVPPASPFVVTLAPK
jgi:hypothetical protein